MYNIDQIKLADRLMQSFICALQICSLVSLTCFTNTKSLIIENNACDESQNYKFYLRKERYLKVLYKITSF